MDQSKHLSHVLNELPEWEYDSQMHALFCEYDGDESEEFMLEFWKRAIDKVFNNYIQSLRSTIDELRVLFDRKGRKPLGLSAICKALEQRGDLIDIDTIRVKVQEKNDKELSWGSWIGKKLLGGLGAKPQPTNIFVCRSKMQKISRDLIKWARNSKRTIYKLTEISDYLQEFFHIHDEEDVKLILDYLYIEALAYSTKVPVCGKMSDIVKVKINEDDELKIKEKDTACLALSEIIQEIDSKVSKLELNKEKMNEMVLAKIRKGDKLGAKPYLIRKKMIEKKIEELHSNRNNCEQQLFSIETSQDTVAIYHAMREATITQENQRLNINEVEDLMEKNKDLYDEQREVSNALSATNPVEQQELLDELEKLDAIELQIETPPTTKLPLKNIVRERVEEEEEKVPQRKSNIDMILE
ncbi:unnamed protein product [Blepharisma stoltei]|uniref:Uncharacterized protein n=1 Tax=Blepharisma stoltei TaxID=1481888 RepID=A0AAU9IT19_9CILI|nr:unnamed protein product [Blepharisma stoltei]